MQEKAMRSFYLNRTTIDNIDSLARETKQKKMEIVEQAIDITYKIHILSKVWGLGSDDEITILLSDFGGRSSYPDGRTEYQEYNNPNLEGSVQAIGHIAPNISLANNNKKINIYTHRFPIEFHGNLICVGGPKSNEVTKYFLTRTDLKFKGTFKNDALLIGEDVRNTMTDENGNVGEGCGYRTKFDAEKKHIIEDFGLLLKVSNPLERKNTIIIIAGCRAFGTGGAARVVSDYRLTRELIDKLKNNCRYFIAVVEVFVINDVIVNVDIVKAEPIEN